MRQYAAGDELAWLDSARQGSRPDAARYSLVCRRPRAVLEQLDRQPARLRVGSRLRAEDADGWALWRETAHRIGKVPQLTASLSPGWVGYVGFEMARFLERVPTHPTDFGLPLLRLGLFDRAILLEHHRRRALAVSLTGLTAAADALLAPTADDWVERWNAAAARSAEPEPPGALPAPAIHCERNRTGHEQAVARALAYIAAGDIYQVNLAHRLRLEGLGDVLETYAAVRRSNPAPYAALLRWPAGAIASFSPELFLRCRGDAVLTRPIKGTRPRTGDPVLDGLRRRELLASEKDAAELAMIVDLHRNDLGRVCRYGSVRVARPRAWEAHPSVFHTVADVTGRLAPGRDALDLLAACFPAGSVTGVPKIRALEIIAELEACARGAYTGAVGVLGLDGQMTFNVAIRTLQIRGTSGTLYVGGGIVADSDPAAEYDETLDKARGILAGLRSAGPASAEAPSEDEVRSRA